MARGRFRAKVLTWDDILSDADDFPDSDPDLYHHKILAEGDSWFTLGGVPTSNLLFELRFHEPTLIVNIAFPGDTMINMAKLSDNPHLRDTLGSEGLDWDAILLSGGGNDLVDKADSLLFSPAERPAVLMPSVAEYVSEPKLTALLDEITEGYRRIAALRDQPGGAGAGKPIILHGYAYATPRNSPARFFGLGFRGPWIHKAFTHNEIPTRHWLKLSDYLLDALVQRFQALSAELPEFHLVDTRNKLTRAALGTTGEDADWLNEFHPNGAGYEKMARAIEPVLLKNL